MWCTVETGRARSGSGLTFLFPTRFPKLGSTLDKDTERMKVEMFGSYALSFHATKLVMYFSILVALIVALIAAYIAGQIQLMWLAYGTIAFELLILYVIVKRVQMFGREVKYLDILIEKLDSNQPLGSMEEILRNAPK